MTEPKLESRIDVLEISVASLTNDVRDLAGLIKEQSHSFSTAILEAKKDADEKTKILTGEIMKSRTPHWGNIIAGLGLALLIVGGLYYPINKSLDTNNEDIKVLKNAREEDAYHRGLVDAQLEILRNKNDK